jgi:hypothetical protein
MPLSLEEQYETAKTVNVFARLITLDRVWTDYLRRAERPIPEQDMEVLTALVGEMTRLLEDAEDRARYLYDVIAEHRVELYEASERMLTEVQLTVDQRKRLQDVVMRYGHIAEYGRTSADWIVEMAPSEREALAIQLSDIGDGGVETRGDLSPQFLCNIAAGCIVGGLLAPPPMNLVAVGIGLLTIAHVEYAMGEEC